MLKNIKFKLFIRLLMSYILVFLIPFIVFSTIISNYVIGNYKSEILSLNLKSINYIRYMLDERLSEIDAAKIQITGDAMIKNFMSRKYIPEYERAYAASAVAKRMKSYYTYKDTVAGLELYAPNVNCIVTASSTYSKKEYYETFLKMSGITYKKWCEELDENGEKNIKTFSSTDSDGKPVILIVQPISWFDSKDSFLFTVVDAGAVLNAYHRFVPDELDTHFYITSADKILFSSENKTDDIDIKKVLSSEETYVSLTKNKIALRGNSISTELNYICVISEKSLFGKVERTNMLLMIVISLISVIFIIVAFILSRKTFSPIKELLNYNPSDEVYRISNFKDLKNMAVNIVNSDKTLRDIIENQRICIKDNMFDLFVQDSMEMSEASLETLFVGTPVSVTDRYFRAVIIKGNGNTHTEAVKLHMLSVLEKLTEGTRISLCVIPTDNTQIILTLSYCENKLDIKKIFEKAVNFVNKNLNIGMNVSIGREVEKINMFSKSYEDAFFALLSEKSGVLCDENSKNSIGSDYFVVLDRTKFKSHILAGDTASVSDMTRGLYERILSRKLITHRMKNYIRYWLVDLFNETAREGNCAGDKYRTELSEAMEIGDFNESVRRICGCFAKMAEYINKRSDENSSSEIKRVLCYIDDNYMLYEISLRKIAEDMHISYNYLSDLFKKQTGKKFLEYLHGVRNKKAKEYLITTDMQISEIAEKVGYLSDNTFIKTFKKLNGITPGEFRKIKRGY